MPVTELPHTAGCMVCGRQNPQGLHLSLHVDTDTGSVTVDFTARPEHIGFEGIVHGGILATIIDEAMVWAATWAGRRFCVCGEMNVRYRKSVTVGAAVRVIAKVKTARSKLIETTATIVDSASSVYATATGKHVPVSPERNAEFVATLVDEPSVASAMRVLNKNA